MDLHHVIEAAGLAALATCNVGLWTLRVAVAAAGRRLMAAVIAGLESLLFALAFGTVISSLDDPLRVGAYAIGVALGTLVGVIADERLSTGQSLVRIVVDGDGEAPAAELRGHGWPVTCTRADGVRGLVAVLLVAVDDAALHRLRADLDRVVPSGFLTVERLRSVRPASLPPGMHEIGRRPLARRLHRGRARTGRPAVRPAGARGV